MSNFGPPVGQPDPWDGRPGDGYPPPPDPRHTPGYAGQPGGWGEPSAPRPAPPTQRYEPSASWESGSHPGYPPVGPGDPPYPEPPRPRRGKAPLLAVLAVVLVLLLGAAVAFWVFGRDEPAPVSGAAVASAPAVDPTAEAGDPGAPATAAAAPASSTDPRFVQSGQCVRNDGSTGQPRLMITECTPKTYEVLSRIDGPTSGKKDAEAKCAKVEGYTDWFFFDSELDTLDFVLCLKRR
ncbi:flagellar basal body protein FliL [Micromonospora sp. MS34]|uniref:LppU/SCO3897 family protein n=1 Tax=Micromonospora sp. MS34 TaxID=3385971 RepID=UPI0039A2097D